MKVSVPVLLVFCLVSSAMSMELPKPVYELSCDEIVSDAKDVSLVDGKVGKALRFDGVSQAIDTGLTKLSGRMTVSCWIKLVSSPAPNKIFISKNAGNDSGFVLRYNSPLWGVTAEIFNSDKKTSKLVRYPETKEGVWYHLAFTYANKKLSSYLNGTLIQSIDSPQMSPNDLPVKINAENSGGFCIDAVRIYNRALSEGEVRALWDGDWRSYEFDGSVSEDTLNSYLSRAVTDGEILSPTVHGDEFREQMEIVSRCGVKFLGRASIIWGAPARGADKFFECARTRADYIHDIDPDIVLQAAILECIYPSIEKIRVPSYVFDAFGQPAVNRNFDYKAMLFDNGRYENHWHKDASVPDMSKVETQMWFYYCASRYIDSGIEAFHMGQVLFMGQADKGYAGWQNMLAKVRAYAKAKARRHFVFIDAHSNGIVIKGRSLFDFNSFPLRIKYAEDSDKDFVLQQGYRDSIYGRSKACVTPSGWRSDSLPYLVEFDNWDKVYDEITLFAAMPRWYRDRWLRYAWEWVRVNDPSGWVQPAMRRICGGIIGDDDYSACDKSDVIPDGRGDWPTIRDLFHNDIGKKTAPKLKNPSF